MAQRLEVARHPLTLGAGLQENPRARPVPQHRGEPLLARDDASLGDRAVLRLDRELALAFVEIKPYRFHWQLASRCAPRRKTVSASQVVGQKLATTLPWRSSCRFIPTKRTPLGGDMPLRALQQGTRVPRWCMRYATVGVLALACTAP